jgi:hypothetical protein
MKRTTASLMDHRHKPPKTVWSGTIIALDIVSHHASVNIRGFSGPRRCTVAANIRLGTPAVPLVFKGDRCTVKKIGHEFFVTDIYHVTKCGQPSNSETLGPIIPGEIFPPLPPAIVSIPSRDLYLDNLFQDSLQALQATFDGLGFDSGVIDPGCCTNIGGLSQ